MIVQVDDGRGGSTHQRYDLSVIEPPPNRPPLFTSLPVVSAHVNTPYSYQATAEDPDGDPLTYSLGEAVTTTVVVTNSSFEAQVLSDGASTGALTGWTITGGTAAGTLNPGSAQYPGSAVTDGLNVAYSSGPTISQVLTERVTAGTRYTPQGGRRRPSRPSVAHVLGGIVGRRFPRRRVRAAAGQWRVRHGHSRLRRARRQPAAGCSPSKSGCFRAGHRPTSITSV